MSLKIGNTDIGVIVKGSSLLQDKIIAPTEQQQTVSADSGYDGLGTVTVGAIGTENLTAIQNGNYTPTVNKYFKNVSVNVPIPEQPKWTTDGRLYYENMTFPSGTTAIGLSGDNTNTGRYSGISGIQTVVIPDTVTAIHTSAFSNCTNLSNITFGSGLLTIGQYAFVYTKITTLDLSSTQITSLGAGAFSGCRQLTTLSLPATITSINNSGHAATFRECSALKTVNLGNGFLCDINFLWSTQFTADDIVAMFNKLGNVPTGETRTFTLGATNLAKLTDAQKQIATDKGWTLA